MGFFGKIIKALKKTSEVLSYKIEMLFNNHGLTDEFYDELEELLITSDMGVTSSVEIIEELREYVKKNRLKSCDDVKKALKDIIKEMLETEEQFTFEYPCVITVIGVNGVGKTTTIGKMANYFKEQKKDVIMVAGDTFRAAASDQLTEWANRAKVKIIKHGEGADASAVVFDGITSVKAKKVPVLIVDTAGRLHTNVNLMEELKKINRIIKREYEEAHIYNLIVLDAQTGQNAVNQIKTFNDAVNVDGIVLTKLDGTAKGGVIIPIYKEVKKPVVFVGVGEKIDDLELFDINSFVDNLF